ncbi:Fanconi anemia group B protein isoform X2 [Protopterus annectens]|uniref:Fanconi anemia group B protein isoform X2 n=1 Tax=Protopterus annectens TaxID=7888 RepID=UPI001CFB134E|nr:Fanconi anemia group B protein isoform X2 [Protopterus annectens]
MTHTGDEHEKILAFNGEILIFKLSDARSAEKHNEEIVLYFSRMVFDTNTGKFFQHSTGHFCIEGQNMDTQLVFCGCTTDHRTGQILPCILLRKHKARKSVYEYLFLLVHDWSKVEKHLDFKLAYNIKDDVKLLPGPTVLWSHKETIFYTSSNTPTIISMPVQVTSLTWAGEIAGEDVLVLGTGKPVLPTEEHQIINKADKDIWCCEFIGFSVKSKTLINGSCFLPHAYSKVVMCLFVWKARRAGSLIKTSVIAATCKKQLIWFQDGIPKDVCHLDVEDPCEIQMAKAGRGSCYFIVYFKCRRVCVVWKDNWQVVASWDQVKSVQVDDFLGVGTEQMLLLFEAPSHSAACCNAFRMTDLGDINYTSDLTFSEKEKPNENVTQDNCLSTIQALEARLQTGLAALQDLQHQLQLKEDILFTSCKALTDIVQGKKYVLPLAETDGLTSLWDEEGTVLHPPDQGPSSVLDKWSSCVEKIWQRTVENYWVVGVKLANPGGMLLTDVSLSFLMVKESCSFPAVIQSFSRGTKLLECATQLSHPHCQEETFAKKRKVELQDEQVLGNHFVGGTQSDICTVQPNTVTCVTDLLPLLACSRVHCVLLLHARKINTLEKSTSEGENLVLPCGRVSLNIEDLCSRKYSVNLLNSRQLPKDVAMEDFFAIQAAFCKFSFRIISTYSTLVQPKEWLFDYLQCVQLEVCPQYLLCTKPGILQGSLFMWISETLFEGTLTVFCSEEVLLQCVHSLLNALSPTCEVKPQNLGNGNSLTESLALAVESELLSFKKSCYSLINTAETNFNLSQKAIKKISCVAATKDVKEQVQHCREELQNEQKFNSTGTDLTVEGDQYREVLEKLVTLQMDSDSAAQKLCKCMSAFSTS